MAIGFDGGSGYLELPQAVATTTPLTLAVRFRPFNLVSGQTLLKIDTNGGRAGWELLLNGGKVQARTLSTSSSAFAEAAGSYVSNVWQSAIGEFSSDVSRKAWLDNAGEGSNATAMGATGVNRVMLGARWLTTVSLFFDGWLASPAIWAGTLSPEERQAFHEGVDPLLIRPDICLFAPELLNPTQLIDRVSGLVLVATGGITKQAHPRTIWPAHAGAVQILPEVSPPPPPPSPLPMTSADNPAFALLAYEKPWMVIPPVAETDGSLSRGAKQMLMTGSAETLWAGTFTLAGADSLSLGFANSDHVVDATVADTLSVSDAFSLARTLNGADTLVLSEAASRVASIIVEDILTLDDLGSIPAILRGFDTLSLSDDFETFGDISCQEDPDYVDL